MDPIVIYTSKNLKVRAKTKRAVDLFGKEILDAVAFMFQDDTAHFMVCGGPERNDYCFIDDLGTIVMVQGGASLINYWYVALIHRDWEIVNRRVMIEKTGRL